MTRNHYVLIKCFVHHTYEMIGYHTRLFAISGLAKDILRVLSIALT